jgi:FtsH-binding integral membrane protein
MIRYKEVKTFNLAWLSTIAGASLVLIVMFVKPTKWWELLFVIALTGFVFGLCTWTLKRKNLSIAVTVGVVGLVILNRLGLLSWLSFGILIVVLGVLGLLN